MDGLEELVGDPRDRDVGDLELLLPQQVEQQVERAGERVEPDHEARPRAERAGGRLGRGHPGGSPASSDPIWYGAIQPPSSRIITITGVSSMAMAPRKTNSSRNSGR